MQVQTINRAKYIGNKLAIGLVLQTYYKSYTLKSPYGSCWLHGSPSPRTSQPTLNNSTLARQTRGTLPPHRPKFKNFKSTSQTEFSLPYPYMPAWRGEVPWAADLLSLSTGRPWLRC